MRAILAASLGSLCAAALLAPSASAATTAPAADAVPAQAGAADVRTAPADRGSPT
ncbi:hypothetical protein H3146_21470, partial [Streptomyces sp. OF3]|nr:hypothetical protein [Streptomyces alkaliterrae]